MLTLTSRCGITPESAEADLVDATLVSVSIAKEVGEKRLLLARLQWDNLFESASPPGALTPKIARLNLTRESNRQRWARSKALRSGPRAFLAALAR